MKLPSGRLVLPILIVAFLLVGAGRMAAAQKEKGSGIIIDTSKLDEAPGKKDARYTAEGLRQAFAALCKKLGYRALTVEVDQSESPFLVYGELEGRCDYRAIRDTLNTMPGYAYVGSVTSVRRDGSGTVFALNLIPQSESSRARNGQGGQRTMERLKVLVDSQR